MSDIVVQTLENESNESTDQNISLTVDSSAVSAVPSNDQSVSQSVSQSINQSTNQSTSQLINQPSHPSIALLQPLRSSSTPVTPSHSLLAKQLKQTTNTANQSNQPIDQGPQLRKSLRSSNQTTNPLATDFELAEQFIHQPNNYALQHRHNCPKVTVLKVQHDQIIDQQTSPSQTQHQIWRWHLFNHAGNHLYVNAITADPAINQTNESGSDDLDHSVGSSIESDLTDSTVQPSTEAITQTDSQPRSKVDVRKLSNSALDGRPEPVTSEHSNSPANDQQENQSTNQTTTQPLKRSISQSDNLTIYKPSSRKTSSSSAADSPALTRSLSLGNQSSNLPTSASIINNSINPSKIQFSYNQCPVFSAPHPLSNRHSAFCLSLTAFGSSSIMLFSPFQNNQSSAQSSNPDIPAQKVNRAGSQMVFSARGDMHRAKINHVSWVPSLIECSTPGERSTHAQEREDRAKMRRKREAKRSVAASISQATDTEEDRRRRARAHRRDLDEELIDHQTMMNDKYDELSDQFQERAFTQSINQSNDQPAIQSIKYLPRLGWDHFLVAYDDGVMLWFDRTIDEEFVIDVSVDQSSSSSSQQANKQPNQSIESSYFHVFPQSQPECNPVIAYKLAWSNSRLSNRSINQSINSIAWSSSGVLLASAQANGLLSLIDTRLHRLCALFQSWYGGWLCCEFSSNDQLLVAGSEDDSLTVFDVNLQVPLFRCIGHMAFVSCLYFRMPVHIAKSTEASKQSKNQSTKTSSKQSTLVHRFVSGGEDGQILFWELSEALVERQRHKYRRKLSSQSSDQSSNHHIDLAAPVHVNPSSSLAGVPRLSPVARNLCHAAALVSMTGSHTYLQKRAEYRRYLGRAEDEIESQSIPEITPQPSSSDEYEREFIVSACLNMEVRVWGSQQTADSSTDPSDVLLIDQTSNDQQQTTSTVKPTRRSSSIHRTPRSRPTRGSLNLSMDSFSLMTSDDVDEDADIDIVEEAEVDVVAAE